MVRTERGERERKSVFHLIRQSDAAAAAAGSLGR